VADPAISLFFILNTGVDRFFSSVFNQQWKVDRFFCVGLHRSLSSAFITVAPSGHSRLHYWIRPVLDWIAHPFTATRRSPSIDSATAGRGCRRSSSWCPTAATGIPDLNHCRCRELSSSAGVRSDWILGRLDLVCLIGSLSSVLDVLARQTEGSAQLVFVSASAPIFLASFLQSDLFFWVKKKKRKKRKKYKREDCSDLLLRHALVAFVSAGLV
jgi:hypothetical protein